MNTRSQRNGQIKSNVALLVSSIDEYSDCWEPLFYSFRTYWPNCPYDKYLITNYRENIPGEAQSISVGEDKGWSNNLRKAISKIKFKYILYFQEDYWLNQKVDDKAITNFIDLMEKNNICYLRLVPYPPPHSSSSLDPRLGQIGPEEKYRTSLQPAIWKLNILNDLLKSNESPWEFEKKGSKRSRKYECGFLSVKSNEIMDYVYHTAIIGGKWSYSAQKWARKEDVEVNSSDRPKEKWFDNFKRANKTGRFINFVLNLASNIFNNPSKYLSFSLRLLTNPKLLIDKISEKRQFIKGEKNQKDDQISYK